jgi:hypothetical protein
MPPQGGWQPQQSGGQPPYGPPPGGHPQYPGQQQRYSVHQPPGFPQGPLPQQPASPPPNGNSIKWLLIAIAVLLVVGISIGATLLFTREGGTDPSNPPTPGTPSDIASANDTGPIEVIATEPTCDAYYGLNDSLADIQANGWGEQRLTLGAATQWTPEQRAQVEEVARAMENTADQLVELAKQTPHRLVRELYEQFIAYSRAYAESVPTYVPADNYLATVTVSAGGALAALCNSIEYGSASRAVAIAGAEPPSNLAKPINPNDAVTFISGTDNSACNAWISREEKAVTDTKEWSVFDTSIPASQWSAEQRAAHEAVLPIMATYANDMDAAGRASGNPVIEDFATGAAQYLRAFVSAGLNYVKADGWLSNTAFRLGNVVTSACQAFRG